MISLQKKHIFSNRPYISFISELLATILAVGTPPPSQIHTQRHDRQVWDWQFPILSRTRPSRMYLVPRLSLVKYLQETETLHGRSLYSTAVAVSVGNGYCLLGRPEIFDFGYQYIVGPLELPGHTDIELLCAVVVATLQDFQVFGPADGIH